MRLEGGSVYRGRGPRAVCRLCRRRVDLGRRLCAGCRLFFNLDMCPGQAQDNLEKEKLDLYMESSRD
jgi:hypothetical protein